MTFDELVAAILSVIPDAVFEEDNEGQLIIYTGLRETDGGGLEAFESQDD